MCLDYLEAGTLYGGQPYCAQTPIIYYLMFVLQRIFGDVFMLYIVWALIIFAHIVNYHILGKILKRLGIFHNSMFLVLYVFIVYRFLSFITSTIATTFLVAGFYLLYYGPRKHVGVSTGILFTLAVFTKYTTVLPIVFSIVYYLIMNIFSFTDKGRGRIKMAYAFQKKPFTDLVIALSFIVITFIFFIWLYPNFILYTYQGHQGQLLLSLENGIKLLLVKRGLNTLSAVLILACILYSIGKGFFNKDTLKYPFITLTIYFSSVMHIMLYGVLRIGSHYMLPVYPFMVIAFMVLWKKSRRLFSLLFLVTLVFPSIYTPEVYGSPVVDLSRAEFIRYGDKVKMDVGKGFSFIPPQDGHVLVELIKGERNIIEEYSIPVDPEKIDVIIEDSRGFPSFEDPAWAYTLRKMTNLSYPYSQAYEEPLTKDEKKIQEQLLSGKYSMIIIAPPAWASTSRIVYSSLEYTMANYCMVHIPDFFFFGSGREGSTFLFKDDQDCMKLLEDMNNYYNANFSKYCMYGERPVKVISEVFKMNQMELWGLKDCKNPPAGYHPSDKDKVLLTDLLIIIVLYPLVSLFLAGFRKLT